MGRFVVIGILLAASALGGAVYITLKNAKNIQESVTAQLEQDFLIYALRAEPSGHLELGSGIYVDLRKPWNIELIDKAIEVTTPEPEPEGPTPADSLFIESARAKVAGFLKLWLQVQFPKESSIDLKVKFKNELP